MAGDCDDCELAEIQRVLMGCDMDALYAEINLLKAELRHVKAINRNNLRKYKEHLGKARDAFKKLNDTGETK